MARAKKLPETLNTQERQALLSALRLQAPRGHRDLSMITLMLNTGLRASEVLHLRVRDIDWTSPGSRGSGRMRGFFAQAGF